MEYLNERIIEDPRISMNWKLKGDILCELECYEEAVRCYQKSLWVRSEDLEDIKTDIYYGLAICYQHLGQIRKAITNNKRLLKYDAADAAALLNLSKLFGEDLKQYTTAQKYAEQLVRLHPENGYGHHNLGLIYLYTRKFDKAKWHLYRARKLVPNYQPIHDAIEELNRMRD
jgi:tetratricopeptide (TPR) repeat protein